MTDFRKAARTPTRVIVVGAGSAGHLVVREILKAPHLGLVAVAFADDDPAKQGMVSDGITVMGTTREIGRIARETGAELAVLAMPSAPGHVVRDVVALCRTLKFPLRTVPSLSKILAGMVKVISIRDIDVEDLLRRAPARIDPASGRYLAGSSVLVTGAGGSIGSELCRQVLAHAPSHLVLFDVSENALYEIDRDLRKLGSPARIVPVLGNIRDRSRLERVLKDFRPGAVFHAAAYKHVSLAETNEDEAVLSIVSGTKNVLEASLQAGVERLVLISSDKAVEPAGIMGASKRVGELLVRQVAGVTGRLYVGVRFGNVLGSSGSVIPLFREQIAGGGPVTVGHPDLERYFMTVQEASSLVVSAGALGRGGEIFVLDMGDPVRIVALAEDLIRLSGFEPGQEIKIVFTGLKPGEKLRESLFNPSETAEVTAHPQIRSTGSDREEIAALEEWLPDLERAARQGDPGRVRTLLGRIIAPTERASGLQPRLPRLTGSC